MYGNQKVCQGRWMLAIVVAMAFSGGAVAASPHYSLVGSMPAKGAGGLIYPDTIVYSGQQIYGYATGDFYTQDGIFSMSLQGKFTKLHEFDDDDGVAAYHAEFENFKPLVALKDGTLFGTTSYGGFLGGHSPVGTAFVVSSGAFQRVHTYYPDLGDTVRPSSLSLDQDGNIYGLAGSKLVSVAPNGQTSVIYDLGIESMPASSLVVGRSGEFYVTLPVESTSSRDCIYEIKDGGESLVHQLDESEGHDIADLVLDANGNLIGSATISAGSELGMLFKVTSGGEFSVVHKFRSDEAHAPSGLMVGADESVYGVAMFGGTSANSSGAIFQVAPNGHYRVLHSFDGTAGAAGVTSLVQGGPRTLYGVVSGGANGTGAIFKLVVPIQDDVNGGGVSSLISTSPGMLTTGAATGLATNRAITAGYYPAAMGDFNGDGIADILWTSSMRDLYIWLGGTGGFTAKYAGTYPTGWKVVGAGDFDGDGMDDLAWTNASTNQFSYWLMNGEVRKGYKIVKYTAGYFPATVGDYDGDGRADVLWSSAKHDLYAWLSRGQGFRSYFVAKFPAAWKITGRGDLDGDGKADLVWSTTDGNQWGYWLMDGGSVRTTKSFSVPAAVSTSHVAAVADYDGDGTADVLWSDGHALTLWENQGGCLDAPGCAFSQSVPSMTLSAGQTVFNSGLPVSQ